MFVVRKSTTADVAGILGCLSAAFDKYRDSYTPGAFLDTVLTQETLAQRLHEMTLFVATEESGGVIGTIACSVINAEEGHIRGMAVLPIWQGTGVAARLLAQVESHLREQNCKRITLDTTEPLKRAIHFYEANGFRPSGKVKDFFGMPLHEYVKTISTSLEYPG